MDILEQKIAIQDESFNKFGWTNNIKLRYYFEKMHNLKKAIELIQKDNNTYFYFLKRCIVTGRTNLFKKLLKPEYMQYWQEDGMQYLLMCSIKFNKRSIFQYLIENYKFSYININVKNAINNLEDDNDAEKFMNPLYVILKANKVLPKVNFSTLCNAHDFAIISGDRFMLYMISRTSEDFNLFGDNSDIINMSFPEYLKVFNYEYKPNKVLIKKIR